jgi:plasmid maintenance system killer protein
VDDYFFVQREILVWRYLATGCKTQKGVLQCPLKQEVKFGSLNAHSRVSTSVSMFFMGPDEVTIKGTPEKLSRIDMKSDSGSWSLWVNDQFKLIRILDTDTNTEVVRD